jgi:hypothetical protein
MPTVGSPGQSPIKQLRELLNQHIGPEFIEDTQANYEALATADNGDPKPFQDRIKAGLQSTLAAICPQIHLLVHIEEDSLPAEQGKDNVHSKDYNTE